MHKDVLIMGLGVFVAFLPFLGFPSTWDTALMVVAGIFIIGLGITVRRSKKSPKQLSLYQDTPVCVPRTGRKDA
jgi:hypothetical protein